MTFVDYYKTLGIAKTASQADIKNAYRKLARKYHPDLNQNDKDAHKNFQEINEANEVLSDVEKRKKYDTYGKDWKHSDEFEKAQQQQRTSQQQGSRSYGTQSGGDFSDFFESMFGGAGMGGGRANRQAKYRGEDFNAELHLDLLAAYKTHTQIITVNDKNIRITIPAGIENGQTIKIAGHGGQGTNGAPNGDLLITFVIANNEHFKRLGDTVYVNSSISLYTAVLGGDIIIDTLSGKVKLQVKPETQNGSKIKLKGKGFPVYKSDGSFGDLIITFTVDMPTHINEKQRALFTELSNIQ